MLLTNLVVIKTILFYLFTLNYMWTFYLMVACI